MSKIQEKPFIQEVAENIGSSLRASLLNLVNGSEKTPAFRSLVNPNNYITDADKNKASYITLETWNRVYTGYLVYNSSYCVLIAYTTNTEALVILDINISKMTYKIVKQPLSILELRVCLGDASGSGVNVLTVHDSSGTLTDDEIALAKEDGTVLRLGDGGNFYYKDTQSNFYIVYKAAPRVVNDDTIVEKITIDLSDNTYSYAYDVIAAGESFTLNFDGYLSTSSTNAVQNKVVTTALNTKADNSRVNQQQTEIDQILVLLGTLLDNFVVGGTLYSKTTTISGTTATMVGSVNGTTVVVA